MLELQNQILEMVARGDGLKDTIDQLCLAVEQRLPDSICSMLTVDPAGRLHPLSGPRLPDSYSASFENLPIGPLVGSCGTAAFLQQPVVVEAIAQDPRWERYRHLALPIGLRACWSSPIFSSSGGVIGTFALYYRTERCPAPVERELVAACTHLCAIAIERHVRVTERERRSYADDLTRLPNRACLHRDLDHLSRDPAPWALMLVDLDNLKVVNDTLGHGAGDTLLQVTADRIQASCAPDRVYRQGGDEFVVVVRERNSLENLKALGETILADLSQPAVCGGNTILPRATIGAASSEDGDAAALLRNADIALCHAKTHGKGGVCLYVPGLGERIAHRASLVALVEGALEEDRIDAFYQPIVRLDTQEIVGLEALCRIIRPDGSVQSAGEFQEATNDVQVSSRLTRRMLEIVARDIKRWLGMGIPFQHVGVNVSSADFHTGRLAAHLVDVFREAGVPLKHVVVEVTEGVFIGQQDPTVARTIQELRAAGLLVALDDFGTGYASLTHLQGMPVDILKIDRSFVANLAPGSASLVIVEGLVRIARGLGLRVVAEGIETSGQALRLHKLGCTLGQGFLYSPAVDRKATTRALLACAQPLDGNRPAGRGARKKLGKV